MCSQGELYSQQRCCSLRLLSGVIVYRKSTHKPNLITTPVDSPTTLDPAKPQTKGTVTSCLEIGSSEKRFQGILKSPGIVCQNLLDHTKIFNHLYRRTDMNKEDYNLIRAVLKQLSQNGTCGFGEVMTNVFNIAMQLEREEFLGATHYERTDNRRAYANGYKERKLHCELGTLTLSVPKTANHGDTPFYPTSIQRGRQRTQTVDRAIRTMYRKGVSTRRVEDVLKEFGIENLSSTTVSRVRAEIEDQLESWRSRPLQECPYLVLDARYDKVRVDGAVRDVAILTAIGINRDGTRSILGVAVSLSEAEVYWRDFLVSLVERGLTGVEYIVSDDHYGLKAARRAVFSSAKWQRCQFHLSKNAVARAPNKEVRKSIGRELRAVYNSSNAEKAQQALDQLVEQYNETHPKFADWLKYNVPDCFTVFSLPENHQFRMRTSNLIERVVQQEIKRRTRLIRVSPSEKSLLNLATEIVRETDEMWLTENRKYLTWEDTVDQG